MENQIDKIIEALGGTQKVAALVGITPGAVSQWRRKRIPPVTLMYLRKIRPKVFKVMDQTLEIYDGEEQAI